MSQRMNLELWMDKEPAPARDLAFIRAAYGLAASSVVRARLAKLLLEAGDVEGVIVLLDGANDLAPEEELHLASAWLNRRSQEGREKALTALGRALALTTQPEQRSAILTQRAEIEQLQGWADAAHATLVEALLLDPHNVQAGKRMATMALGVGQAEELLALVDRLIERGAHHAWLFAGRALCLARLGDTQGARNMLGGPDLHHVARLDPPQGWEDIAAFNRALAGELANHPGLRRRRYGAQGQYSSRIDAPLTAQTPLVRLLLERIAAAIHLYLGQIEQSDHPWARARPERAILSSSCVITDSDGFEAWHIHPFAWLSGAYYVEVPDAIAAGTGDAGCIAFGLPETLVGAAAAAAFGRESVRPQDGLLLMFPSHIHHRTFPHKLADRRICFTIDVRPTA